MKLITFSIFLILFIHLSHEFEELDDEHSANYDHIRRQFMNLQAAQRNIQKKKAEESPDPPAPQQQNTPVELRHDYSHVDNWPTSSKKLGAIGGVSLDVYKNVVAFHRHNRVWQTDTFDSQNRFLQQGLGPIKENTVVTFDRNTGNVISEWGKDMFFMPHGLHINGNYYYLTDVALHQVFRFNVKKSTVKPELVLGEAFKPGRSAKLFCKPTSVAQLENGDFFVADGYCNSRIVKFSFSGEKLLEWGKSSFQGMVLQQPEPPYAFAVPHALTLIPDQKLLCVADRENGRVQCFFWTDGKYHSQYHSPLVGDRLFSVDYANNSLFVVNGPDGHKNEIAGYTFDIVTGNVTSTFGSFHDPHDIAVTSDGHEIYVGDLSEDNNGMRLHKYLLNGVKPTITHEGDLYVSPSKITMHRGETALIVGSIVLLFTIFTVGIAILISKRKRRVSEETEYHSLMTK